MFRPTPLQNVESDSEDEDEDPLEEEVIRSPTQTTLFDDGFGDIGLAGSIFRVLGTPTVETWPVSSGYRLMVCVADPKEFESWPDAGKIDFITCTPQPLGSIFPTMTQGLVNLTTTLLQLSPSRRLSARKALDHPYFDTTLVPSRDNAWYGNPPIDLSSRCVEMQDGRRLVDHLADILEWKREIWAP
jgi:serine/threonine protein kinase